MQSLFLQNPGSAQKLSNYRLKKYHCHYRPKVAKLLNLSYGVIPTLKFYDKHFDKNHDILKNLKERN